MRKVAVLIAIGLFLGQSPVAIGAPKITPGTKCKKANEQTLHNNKVYTCIKLGKKLYWDNGKSTRVANPPTNTTPSPEPSPVQTPQRTNSLSRDNIKPAPVSSLTAKWEDESLVLDFQWVSTNPFKDTKFEFIVNLQSEGVSKLSKSGLFKVDQNKAQQILVISKEINQNILGVFRTNLENVCVFVRDQFYNDSVKVCADPVPKYVLNLSKPTITVNPAASGYIVNFTPPNSGTFDAIEVVEYESTETNEPQNSKYSRVYFGNSNPIPVVTPNYSPRWVKARFTTRGGGSTEYSLAVKVTPVSPIQVR